MKKKSVTINYMYNAIFQLVTLLTVFITTPYIARILGAEQLGIYSYTYAIVTYFILIGSLGTAMYGQREIAYNQDNIKDRSKIFYEILGLKFIILLFITIIYFVFFCTSGDYSIYYKLLLFELIGSGIDIIWLYQGLEDFKRIVIRNVIVKISLTLLIFVFVKQKSDLWIYFLLVSLSTFLGNFTLWFSLPHYIEKVNLKTLNIKRHIAPVLVLFIPQIAVKIYTVLDKTMLGLMTSNMSYVSYYQKSQEIVYLATTILTVFGAVIFPKIANAFIKKDENELNACVFKSFSFNWLIGIPLTIGLIACANNFIPWYLGKDFLETKLLLKIFCLILLPIGLNNVVGAQFLIATKKQKEFTISVAIGAVVNVICNYILIKHFAVIGAVVASILAEVSIMIAEFIYMKKYIGKNVNFKLMFQCLFAGGVMYVIVYSMGTLMNSSIITTLIQATTGLLIYFIILVALRIPMVINTLKAVLNKLNRKIV